MLQGCRFVRCVLCSPLLIRHAYLEHSSCLNNCQLDKFPIFPSGRMRCLAWQESWRVPSLLILCGCTSLLHWQLDAVRLLLQVRFRPGLLYQGYPNLSSSPLTHAACVQSKLLRLTGGTRNWDKSRGEKGQRRCVSDDQMSHSAKVPALPPTNILVL